MIRIYSIFRSIDGEVNYWGQGTMCTFIRFAGCNLNCHWCDTEYAKESNSGQETSVAYIMHQVERLGCQRVTITGGEPYEQVELLEHLVHELQRKHHRVSIETNGSHEPMWVSENPSHVVDYKLPSSGMEGFMKMTCFFRLRRGDFVKFVIRDRKDFAVATHVRTVLIHNGCRARFAFSAISPELHPRLLLEWMDKEELYDSILNVQLHKLLDLQEDA